jgi:lysozyme
MMGSPICIDLSHHNRPESFREAYDHGIRLVIHKATQGRGFIDPDFRAVRDRLAEHLPDMKFGAYHFADARPVQAQVRHFLQVARGVKLLALDWEDNHGGGGTMSLAQAEAFVQMVFDKTGRWPLLYSGSTLKANPPKKGSPLLNCELWLAQYADEPTLPAGWKSKGFRLWQYTDGQAGPDPTFTPGIGHVDRSIFNGTPEDMDRWFKRVTA